MLARSPRRQSSVASSPRAGAPGPRRARGAARPVPGSPRARPLAQPLSRSRRPRPAGRASAPARRPPSAAPQGDTRRRPRRRLPRAPLLRLGQVYSNPSSQQRRILLWRERWKLGGRSRHRQPLPGVGTPSTLFCQERVRRQPERRERCDLALPRLAAEPSPRPLRGAAGAARAEGRGGGSRTTAARGSLPPSCPIGAGPGTRRAAGGGWWSASQGRGASATDTCLQGSAPRARALLRAGPPPAGRVGGGPRLAIPAPPPAPPLREAPHRLGPAPTPLPSRATPRRAPCGTARGYLGPLRRALPASPSCYSRQQLLPRDTHSPTATCKTILAIPGDLRNPAER